MKNDQVKIGPVQLLAIGFTPEAKFEGKILEELQRLDQLETIRLLDLLFIKRDKNLDIVALDVQGEDLGAIVGALLGFEFDEIKTASETYNSITDNNSSFGLSPQQIEQIGESLQPGMAAAVLLIEHVWAKPLKKLIRENHGFPIAEGFITPEALAKVAAEIEALSEEMESLENKTANNQKHHNIHHRTP